MQLNDEQREELLIQVRKGTEMKRLIDLPAWQEILKPDIIKRRDSLIQSLYRTPFNNLNEVHAMQQGINALENLLSCVEDYIQTGLKASEILKSEN